MTYLLVDLPFLAVAAVLLVVVVLQTRRPARSGNRPDAARRGPLVAIGVALAGVLVLTAVFDNVIIGLGIVDYDPAHVSGLRIGLAPVEDFAYAVAAGIGLPALWLLLPRKAGDR